ncbi:MAG: hypothetical protein AB7V16_07235 [Vulcanibacillus sp.]
MKFYTENQIKKIRKSAFNEGYQYALLGDLPCMSACYLFSMKPNFQNLIPDIDKKSVIQKIVAKVFYYFIVLTDQKIAYGIVEKEVLKALESIKPIENT